MNKKDLIILCPLTFSFMYYLKREFLGMNTTNWGRKVMQCCVNYLPDLIFGWVQEISGTSFNGWGEPIIKFKNFFKLVKKLLIIKLCKYKLKLYKIVHTYNRLFPIYLLDIFIYTYLKMFLHLLNLYGRNIYWCATAPVSSPHSVICWLTVSHSGSIDTTQSGKFQMQRPLLTLK